MSKHDPCIDVSPGVAMAMIAISEGPVTPQDYVVAACLAKLTGEWPAVRCQKCDKPYTVTNAQDEHDGDITVFVTRNCDC